MKRYSIFFVVFLIVAVGLFWLLQNKKQENFSHYRAIKVQKGDVVESVEATGVIKPSIGAEVKIGARMSGTVIDEPIKVGDFVKKGTLIAKIDDREQQKALEIAKEESQKVQQNYPKDIATLQSAQARAKTEVQKASLSLQAAKADAATAQWLCQNKKRLFQRGTTSQKEMRITCTEAFVKKKEVQKTQKTIEEKKRLFQEARLALQKTKQNFIHDRAIAQAKVDQAKIRLSYSTITAPFDGIITYISTQKGETVVAGLNAPQFAKILDPKRLENRLYIDETAIAKVKEGMKVEFGVDALPKRRFYGSIDQIYPQPEIQNSVVYYIGVVKNFKDAKLLRPEMTTHNKIIVKIHKNVLRLPNEAVKFKNAHFFVYLKRGDEVVEQPVKPGVSDDRYTEILEGLKAGDTVLMEPANAHRV